jgi:glycosyltransferase involved in cell wall biosynthesis
VDDRIVSVSRPSILAITSQAPWPLDTGGHLRTYHVMRQLAGRFSLRLLVPVVEISSAAQDALKSAAIDARFVQVGREGKAGQLANVLAAAVRSVPYVLYSRHDRSELRRALAEELGRRAWDVIYCDHLDSFVYVDDAPKQRVVGDLHNVYSLLARRTADEQGNPIVRAYLKREARLLDRMERRAARIADLLMTVSQQEQDHFRGIGARRVEIVPNGVDVDRYAALPAAARRGTPLVLYIGTMSWRSNAAAAIHLATSVMPAIRERIPDARLRIVGRDPLPEVRELARDPHVDVTGTVPDVIPHLAEAHALAVPLESGGGTRLKILEAFAAGLPVVSTPVGAEGIDAVPNRDVIVTERAGFADALASLLADPARAIALATAARAVVRAQYDWSAVGARAARAIENVTASASARL